jgi:hypothetical protein
MGEDSFDILFGVAFREAEGQILLDLVEVRLGTA